MISKKLVGAGALILLILLIILGYLPGEEFMDFEIKVNTTKETFEHSKEHFDI